MKRIYYGLLLCFIGTSAGCADNDASEYDELGRSEDELKYFSEGPLTTKAGPLAGLDETARRADTAAPVTGYYAKAVVSSDGQNNTGTISTSLKTLSDFQTFYGFGAEQVTRYYNRGDLGIGREMHCREVSGLKKQWACYVRNFAAGDALTEFQFGMSKDVAFGNMALGNAFATVAMVFRSSDKSTIFMVYGPDGKLADNAPLDRHGLNAQVLKPDSAAVDGVPGTHYNNHIPSNCLNCHGGTYDRSTKKVTGGLFLPFDLDAFDFESSGPNSRNATQEAAFKFQNQQIVRLVANEATGSTANPITRQIDGWYANGSFDSSWVPSEWDDDADDRNVYQAVVRPVCRGCHISQVGVNGLSFESPLNFLNEGPTYLAGKLCSLRMPHAHQVTREFWQSRKPLDLETWFRSLSTRRRFGVLSTDTGADDLKFCAAKDVVTLDPQFVQAASTIVAD